MPVLIHGAEPQDFFEPIDSTHEGPRTRFIAAQFGYLANDFSRHGRVLFGKDSFQPDEFRAPGARSKPPTSISTTIGITTRSGGSTAWPSRMRS